MYIKQLHGRCVILKQMRYCKVVLHYSICVSVSLFIDLSVPPIKEMAVPNFLHSTQDLPTGNYKNIKVN